jgi:hypothetical protein
MSVIVSRALPDVRMALNPFTDVCFLVCRSWGFYPNRPYKKSALIVGEVLGKYLLMAIHRSMMPGMDGTGLVAKISAG